MNGQKLVRVMLAGILCLVSGENLEILAPSVARADGAALERMPAAPAVGHAVAYTLAGPAVYVACDPADISDDIQAAVNTLKPLGGGTIYLPECDAQFLTTVGSTAANVMPGGINIIGQGIGKTILRSDGSTFFDINHWGQYSSGFRISGISFYGVPTGTATNQGIRIANVVDFRIDHCYFERILYNIIVNSAAGYPQSRGVVDHCAFDAKGLTAYGITDSRVWNADMKLGSAEALFAEDCYFNGLSHAAASFGGGHYVLRHSTIVNSASIDAHGPGFDSSGRGARASEIYENEIYRDPGNIGWSAIGLRAGGGVIFNNTFRNFDHAYRFSIDTAGYNATGGVYPTLDQTHDMWMWNDTLIDITYDPSQPGYQDNLANPNRTTVSGVMLYGNNSGMLIQKDRDFHMRAPSLAQDGFTYTPYPYPHPLTQELNLSGTPGNQTIDLNWQVTATLPPTSTWRIDYYTSTVTAPLSVTNILSPTRAYTLTGLTNYQLYTVTLNAMVDTTPILTDTVRVMPTDIFVYLPLVWR